MEDQFEMMAKGRLFKHLMESRSMQLRREFGLKRIELEVLYFLSISGEHNTSADICHYLNVNKGYISQTVDNLCRMGYLNAEPDRRDRRYVHYMLTDYACGVVDGIRKNWDEINHQIFAGITEEERIVYREISRKLKRNMEKMLER